MVVRKLAEILLPGGFFLLISLLTGFAESEAISNALSVKIMDVEREESYKEKRIFVGQVEARQSAEVGFEIEGTVDEILVDEGDIVAEGDTLAVLNADRLEARRREASATLQEAETLVTLTNSTLVRIQGIEVGGVSAQEVDEVRQERDSAVASVNRQRAALERIEVDLEKTRLASPFDAIVIERVADEGRVASIGEPILRLKERTMPEVRIGLANGLADRFEVGERVSLRTNGGRVISTVKAILPVRDARARTVDVILEVDGGTKVRPGDLVEVTIDETREDEGFWVPLSALTETVRGLWSVYSVDEGIAERKVVDLIYQDESRAFVRGNLQTGESIIVDGVHRVVPGQSVRPARSRNPEETLLEEL
ncbi:MAG: efflux RND transporter periplasmic adaptor subunit [Verrucomicrobiota bacterium]